jgi:DNA-binding GntR family transcriptional regulator
MAMTSDPSISMRDLAYRALRRLLVLQRIPDGQRLREPQWAEELGVNRTALREAFARLEAEGLIERGERTGYFVPKLTEGDLDEIKFVRGVLESAAIDLVCANRGGAGKAARALRTICDEFEAFAKSRYSLGTSEADRRFHETLLDSAGNKRLATLYHRAPLPLVRVPLAAEARWDEQVRLIAAEHRAIAEAIAAVDAKKAQRLLREHLQLRHQSPMSV